jgi:tRNA U34 2-thiouridine synthase MnmA/TrmU
VDRGQLLDLQGRQRNTQLELAEKFGVKEFETPAGGCLLTDPAFGKRLKKALEEFPEMDCLDVELLKNGRVYWAKLKDCQNSILVVIGRDKEENQRLEELFLEKDFLLKPENVMGPNVLVRSFGGDLNFDQKEIEIKVSEEKPADLINKDFSDEIELFEGIGILAGWYIKKVRGEKVEFLVNYS